MRCESVFSLMGFRSLTKHLRINQAIDLTATGELGSTIEVMIISNLAFKIEKPAIFRVSKRY
jgi:hypothetical protein